jgi:hypothetical protein
MENSNAILRHFKGKVIIDIDPKTIPTDFEGEYHVFKQNVGIIHPGYYQNDTKSPDLDSYFRRFEIRNVDLLRNWDGQFITPESKIFSDIMSVETTNSESLEILRGLGFTHLYSVTDEGVDVCYQRTEESRVLACRKPLDLLCRKRPSLMIGCLVSEASGLREMKKLLGRFDFPKLFLRSTDPRKLYMPDAKNIICGKDTYRYNPLLRSVSVEDAALLISHIRMYRGLLETEYDYFLVLEDGNIIQNVDVAVEQLFDIPEGKFQVGLLSASISYTMPKGERINGSYNRLDTGFFDRSNSFLFTRDALQKLLANFDTLGVCCAPDNFVEFSCLRPVVVASTPVYKQSVVSSARSWSSARLAKNIAFSVGDLGSTLFRYAVAKVHSMEKVMILVGSGDISKLVGYFVGMSGLCNVDASSYQKLTDEKLSPYHYSQKIGESISSDRNCLVEGGFCSEKYFSAIEDLVRQDFMISDQLLGDVKRLGCLFGAATDRLCGLYMRMKDSQYFPPVNYMINAVKKILDKCPSVKFVVLTDDKDTCLKLYRGVFPEGTIFYGSEDEFLILGLLTFCDDSIYIHGSLGWWGAYLGKTLGSTVVAPKNEFTYGAKPSVNFNDKDYYPASWNVIQARNVEV